MTTRRHALDLPKMDTRSQESIIDQLLFSSGNETGLQSFFALSQELARLGLWYWSGTEAPLRASDECYRIFGIQAGAPLSSYEQLLEHVHVDDIDAVTTAWSASLQGAAYEIDHRITANGSVRWVAQRAKIFFDDHGQLLGAVGVVQDITARKLSELGERNRRTILELIARGTSLPTVLNTIARDIEEESNGGLCSILLLDESGEHLQHAAAPGLPECYNQAVHGLKIGLGIGSCGEAAFTGKRVIVEDLMTHPNWAPYTALVKQAQLGACWSQPFFTANGVTLGTVAMCYRQAKHPSEHDLTMLETAAYLAGIAVEYAKTHAELGKAGERLENLLRHSYDVLCVIDEQGRGKYMSPAATNSSGISAEEMLKIDWFGLIHPDDLERCQAALQRLLDHPDEVVQMQLRTRDLKTGGWSEVETIASNHLNDPTIGGIVVNSRDISGRAAVSRQLERAKEAAEAGSRAKSEFLANMSHEIRTPLNAVIGLSEVLLGTELTDEQRDYLTKMRLCSRSLMDILNDILDLSKIEAGMLGLECTAFSLRDIIQRCKSLFVLAAERKNLTLNIDIKPTCVDHLMGDPLRISQVLSNLLSNAVKFTENGTITIEADTTVHDGIATMRVCVKDSGIGMTPGQIEKLFRPFSQADSSMSRRFGGTGLGLAISKRLVDMMDGRLIVDSKPNAGSLFCIEANLKVADAEPRPQDEQRLASVCHGLSVLLVEDDEVNQLVAGKILQNAGVEVTIANGGGEAVDILRQRNFDLIFMDIQMPGKDGYETARDIRKIPGRSSVPVIALTASAMESDRERCIAAGMNDHMSKPFDADRLVNVVAKWTGRLEIIAVPPGNGTDVGAGDQSEGDLDVDAAMAPLKKLGAGKELYVSIVQTFLIQFGDNIDDFAAYQCDDRKDKCLLRAHTLITSAKVVGASRLSQLADQYDQLLRYHPEDAQLKGCADELVRELKAVVAKLKMVI